MSRSLAKNLDSELIDPYQTSIPVPTLIAATGDHARKSYLDYFTSEIRNTNTRQTYGIAVTAFLDCAQSYGVTHLSQIQRIHVAAYIESLKETHKTASTKTKIAAIRMLCDFLVKERVLEENPAMNVRTEKLRYTTGETSYRAPSEIRDLLDSIEPERSVDLRDRALIATMAYSFARVSATIGMDVEDVFTQGRQLWMRLNEKGGVKHSMPCHHELEEFLDVYLTETGLVGKSKTPLFPRATLSRHRPQLTDKRMTRQAVWAMIKRRCEAAGLPADTTCHSFRATGITTFLENGGSIEDARHMAAHASLKTTQVYDRRRDRISVENVERIRYR